MPEKRYTSSLTSGDLLMREIADIVEAFDAYDGLTVQKVLNKGNYMNTGSDETAKRIVSEAVRRIKAVNKKAIWQLFKKSNEKERKLILFYAVLLTYDLAFDFYLDVVHEKWINFQFDLSARDFNDYVEQKARVNDELEKKSKRSITDMGINLIKIMRQTGILDNGKITEVNIPKTFKNSFNKLGEAWFIDVIPHK